MGCSKASFYPALGATGGAAVGSLGGPGPAAGGAALGWGVGINYCVVIRAQDGNRPSVGMKPLESLL